MMISRITPEPRTRASGQPDVLDLLIRASFLDATAAAREAIPPEWLDMLRAEPDPEGPDRSQPGPTS